VTFALVLEQGAGECLDGGQAHRELALLASGRSSALGPL